MNKILDGKHIYAEVFKNGETYFAYTQQNTNKNQLAHTSREKVALRVIIY